MKKILLTALAISLFAWSSDDSSTETPQPEFPKNVYVGGSDNNLTKVWKNNTSIPLTNDVNSIINDVFVSGTDVYVAGYEGGVLKVWKNNRVLENLTSGIYQAQASSIFVSGSDVYVGGYERNTNGKNLAKSGKTEQQA